MGFPTENVALISIFVESLLYGFFLLMFMISSSTIWREHRSPSTHPARQAANIKLFMVSALMFVLATVHLSASLQRVLNDVTLSRNAQIDQQNQRLASLNNVNYVVQNATYGLQTIIYRMYIVWNRRKWVCIPASFLFLANLVMAAGSFAQVIRHPDTLTMTSHTVLALSFFWLTLLTNTCATILIAGQLWFIRSRIQVMPNFNTDPNHKRVSTAAAIVLESGTVYSLCLGLLIVLYMLKTWQGDVVLDAMPQVI
ncbi:hypothetical protein D9619_004695 [Psilocybe cf. subviscida]|uniref:Uncharacterized protein n=1 Tax=Psilocybe cf. subviscida TaxID=2480587 RepID=A0A8H5F8T1_9AGAR|nr:hypothetical protein D9619_004695 [Psilocybe cf. subviscida]